MLKAKEIREIQGYIVSNQWVDDNYKTDPLATMFHLYRIILLTFDRVVEYNFRQELVLKVPDHIRQLAEGHSKHLVAIQVKKGTYKENFDTPENRAWHMEKVKEFDRSLHMEPRSEEEYLAMVDARIKGQIRQAREENL